MTAIPRGDTAWSAPSRGEGTIDPVDLLLIDEAAQYVSRGARTPRVVIVGDRTGGLTVSAVEQFGLADVRVFQDELDAEQRLEKLLRERAEDPSKALPRIRRLGLEPALVSGATLIIARLPKHLAQLEELTALVASHGDESVRLIAAGRVKHMSRGMNDVLARGFTDVRASLGRQKSRALHAWGPRRTHSIAPFPRTCHVTELGVDVAAHGGVFAGPRLDIGTRVLIEALEDGLAEAGIEADSEGLAVDLGCGTGLVSVALAALRPRMHIIATDRSWSACTSAHATFERAGLDAIEVVRDDAAEGIADATVDLVLLNPPFHEGHGLDDEAAEPLFSAAARILRPGASLLTVFNAHLPHRTALRRIVGPTEQIARTPKFIVTRSVASSRAPTRRLGPRGRIDRSSPLSI